MSNIASKNPITGTSDNPIFFKIPIDEISASPHQARKDFNEESIRGLAESMKLEGLMQPVTVRRLTSPPDSPPYELIAGERRLRAARLLGWAAIEARIVEVPSEAAAAAKGLIENIQRVDLNPIEEAEGFSAVNKLDPVYWTQEKIAAAAGKSQSRISESLRLLELPEQIKEVIRRRIITSGHAVELLRLPEDDLKFQVAKKIETGLSVMETRKLVDGFLKNTKRKKTGRPSPDPLSNVWSKLHTGQRIEASGAWQVTFRKGQWNFSVHSSAFKSAEDLAGWFRQMAEAMDHESIQGDQ